MCQDSMETLHKSDVVSASTVSFYPAGRSLRTAILNGENRAPLEWCEAAGGRTVVEQTRFGRDHQVTHSGIVGGSGQEFKKYVWCCNLDFQPLRKYH